MFQHATLPYSSVDGKWLRVLSIILQTAVHVIVKLPTNYRNELGELPNLAMIFHGHATDSVERFSQIHEDALQSNVFFLIFYSYSWRAVNYVYIAATGIFPAM